jgi:fructose-1,6-bisphosphatase/inositol monophosphatase family enzyme
VREAGGVATDLAGRDLSGFDGGGVVAGNPVVHAWLLRALGSGF